jgi:AcrR family transcriptional regulator
VRESRTPGRPARLSRDAVLEAAEAVLRQGGDAGSLTIRRLASELGTSPMSLYRHVRDKDELLMLLLERAWVRVPKPKLPRDPRKRLVALWLFLHEALLANAWVLDVLIGGKLMAPSAVWVMEKMLEASIAAGMTPDEAADGYRICWTFTIGDLLMRRARARDAELAQQPPQQLQVVTGADPGATPLLRQLAPRWVEARRRNTYLTDLPTLIEGLLP